MKPDFKYLFKPRSVAIIGASDNKNKIGHKITSNILTSGYPGKIYPINPKTKKILGLTVYKSITDIKEEIDLVCIAIPAKYVFQAVKQCAIKKAKFISIITSGFSEIGNKKEERDIISFAKKNNMRILGPNVFGIYSAKGSINATFGPKDIKKGRVAILTQSGALGIALMGKTQTENIGLSAIVSLGNKADINESDLLDYLAEDDNTKLIFMYIEGLKDGRRFINALKKITKIKPVIILKAGKSKKGALAAASHTASLAGESEVFNALMKQCGVIRAESIDEAINRIKFLGNSPVPKGENTVIITNGGGIGVLATDACERHKVKLYSDTDNLKKIFSSSTPRFGSTKNPIDITGQATVLEYENALNAAFKNKKIHSIVCLGCETAVLDIKELSDLIKKLSKQKKPIVYSFLGGKKVDNMTLSLRNQNIPIFDEVDEAISCLGASSFSYRYLSLPKDKQRDEKINLFKINEIISEAKKEKRKSLLPREVESIMEIANISTPQSDIAKNQNQAVKFARKIGYPVVMKVVSKDILHKTDSGGVILNIKEDKTVIAAYEQILKSCRKCNPKAIIRGVNICEMIKNGLEIMVGVRKDNVFKTIVVFGLGGIYVEVFKDINFRSFPLGPAEAKRMIEKIKAYPLLAGARGQEKKDIKTVIDVILKLGWIVDNIKSISDIEINPLLVHKKGVKALDIRVLLS
jgi:acetyltransferase